MTRKKYFSLGVTSLPQKRLVTGLDGIQLESNTLNRRTTQYHTFNQIKVSRVPLCIDEGLPEKTLTATPQNGQLAYSGLKS